MDARVGGHEHTAWFESDVDCAVRCSPEAARAGEDEEEAGALADSSVMSIILLIWAPGLCHVLHLPQHNIKKKMKWAPKTPGP